MENNRQVDHIVYCVLNLEDAVAELEERLGVKPVIGGKHLHQGTKNALVHLGNTCYLEILAVDETNKKVEAPRWMGIDLIKRNKITRWALKTEDAQKDAKVLSGYHPKMGVVKGGERKTPNGDTLKWDLVMPLEEPEVEVIPFMTDWTKSDIHPTDSLEAQCKLLGLEIDHPQSSEIDVVFEKLNIDQRVNFFNEARIQAIIKSPKGIIKL
ncbi:VOC family protein [Portibacter lacus]|uniref:Glyoxalase-like domain-containing protein n=1 Tax=Portibacter lacus TaxID=1099794 RepID=A0AA37WG23_9BACT|nr:VOC family protein [Portibacter lacus]GLR17550.1 hypothetical protein GCM10007940_21650 [Portibacter lacus]